MNQPGLVVTSSKPPSLWYKPVALIHIVRADNIQVSIAVIVANGDAHPGHRHAIFAEGHDGTFRDEALLRGVALSEDGMAMTGMGVAIGDYDCDGHRDIVRTHYMNQATGLYHNDGTGNFEEVTTPS